MTRLQLSLACGRYDRTLALADGRVKPDGLDIVFITGRSPSDIFWRMLNHYEFDASEMSLSSFLIAREQRKPFVAIPVFAFRKFRHSFIFCNTESGIKEPRDLEGKKFGFPEWQQTAGVWIRGMLQDDFGVDLRKVQWFTEREERLSVELRKQFDIKRVPKGTTLDELLVKGDLDAASSPRVMPSFTSGSKKVIRLFKDYRKVEADYYKRTGIFPIMHTLVVREPIFKKYPWVAISLHRAFEQAKQIAYSELESDTIDAKLSYVWNRAYREEETSFLGRDPWPYNIEDNRNALEALMRYSVEQGLTRKTVQPEEMFTENVVEYQQ